MALKSFIFDSKKNRYIGFIRSVFHPKKPNTIAGYVREYVWSTITIENISDDECRFTRVSLANKGEWVAKTSALTDLANVDRGKMFRNSFIKCAGMPDLEKQPDTCRLFEMFAENCTQFALV